jgi:hypothetical protein
LGKVIKKGKMNLEQDEIDEGFELVWLSLEEALIRVKSATPKSYEGSFIQKRDTIFLQTAAKILGNRVD